MPALEPLRRALLAHPPEDAVEAAHRAAMLALCEAAAPFSREHFDPGHFTASAFVLSPAGDALLLIHHAKLHRWLQPGGHVEAEDEDLVAAALRELGEETGLAAVELVEPLFDLDVHLIPARRADPVHRHFDLRVLLRARVDRVEAASDATAARWVGLDEVEGVETDESVMRAVRKLKRRAAR